MTWRDLLAATLLTLFVIGFWVAACFIVIEIKREVVRFIRSRREDAIAARLAERARLEAEARLIMRNRQAFRLRLARREMREFDGRIHIVKSAVRKGA